MTRFNETQLMERMHELKQEYRASRDSRFTPRMRGVSASGSGADYHYAVESQYLHMIERARHYERNDSVVGQGIRRLVANVVQQGFSPDPQTGDPELNKVLKEQWDEWSLDPDLCHSEGELTFPQIERLTLRSTIRDGDVWHLLLDNGQIQAVEAHRPRSPRRTTRNVVNGVMVDDNKRRTEVWITKQELSPYQLVSRVSEVERYPIRDSLGHRNVLQVYFPDRFSQRRGVTALAPCSDTVGQHDDLQFTTLVKAQMASLLVFLREQLGSDIPTGNGPPIGNVTGTDIIDQGSINPIPGMTAGLDVTPPKGQKITAFTPNIPNPEFFPHTMLLLTFIAVNLDLPVQVLLLDPTRVNFSAWRGALDQARMRFREIQSDLVNQFHRPTWKWKVRGWASQSPALRKMIGNNPNWLKHNWKRPSFPYIEPLKDAQADSLQQEKVLNSPRRLVGNRGYEYPEIVNEWIEDRLMLFTQAHEAAAKLQQQFDSDCSWRDILAGDFGALKAVAPPMQEDEKDDEEDDDKEDAKDKQ